MLAEEQMKLERNKLKGTVTIAKKVVISSWVFWTSEYYRAKGMGYFRSITEIDNWEEAMK